MVSESDLEDLLLALMNSSRTDNGIKTSYARGADLDTSAQTHSQVVIAKAMLAATPQAAVCPPQINVPVSTWHETWDADHWCPAEEPSPFMRIQPDWQALHGVPPGENVGSGYWVSHPPQDRWDPPYEAIARSIHSNFMDESPPADGHRRAILSEVYNAVGIGVRVFTREIPMIQQEAYLRFTVDFARV
jgi:hypothetical protein